MPVCMLRFLLFSVFLRALRVSVVNVRRCLPRAGQRDHDVLVVLTDGYGPDPVGAAGATGKKGAEHEQGQQKMNGSQTQRGHGTGKL